MMNVWSEYNAIMYHILEARGILEIY